MSKTTRTLRGGTTNGTETILIRPTPPAKPSRVEPHTVNTLTADDELTGEVRPQPGVKYLFLVAKAGKGGTHIRLKPFVAQHEATVDDVLTAWKDFKTNLPESMTPVLTTWLADHPDLLEEVVDDVKAVIAAEESMLNGTDEHQPITTEIPVVPQPPTLPPVQPRVRVVPPAPEGLVTPEQEAVRKAIRSRVAKIAAVAVLSVPVIAAAVSLFLSTPAMALWVFVGVLSSLIFVGPPMKDAITNGLFKFVTVKLWVELGATAVIAIGIAACLIFGSIEASVALIGVAVIALLIKNSILAVSLAATKMTVIEVREEVVTPPAAVAAEAVPPAV